MFTKVLSDSFIFFNLLLKSVQTTTTNLLYLELLRLGKQRVFDDDIMIANADAGFSSPVPPSSFSRAFLQMNWTALIPIVFSIPKVIGQIWSFMSMSNLSLKFRSVLAMAATLLFKHMYSWTVWNTSASVDWNLINCIVFLPTRLHFIRRPNTAPPSLSIAAIARITSWQAAQFRGHSAIRQRTSLHMVPPTSVVQSRDWAAQLTDC